jgi:hypothetical protein
MIVQRQCTSTVLFRIGRLFTPNVTTTTYTGRPPLANDAGVKCRIWDRLSWNLNVLLRTAFAEVVGRLVIALSLLAAQSFVNHNVQTM